VGLVQNAAHKVRTQQVAKRPDKETDDLPPAKLPRGRSVTSGCTDGPHSFEEGFAAFEQRDFVEFVLTQAPPLIRKALKLCYWEDLPLCQVAKRLGLSRFALSRRIEAFFRKMQSRLELN
jgi:DNA-directed RNA polymerase specialized sigma24 family protein